MLWPSERGWVGIGTFVMSLLVLAMIAWVPELRKDDFFQTVATAIIITGFLNGPVSWAFAATQGGTELAKRNADIVEEQSKRQ